MGLRKKVFYPVKRELTQEEKDRFDLAMKILEEKGCVNMSDPLHTKCEDVIEILKRDPNAFTKPFCDYHGNVPLSTLRKRATDEKQKESNR